MNSSNYSNARILGILNITADSFSDGGRFLEPEAALEQARKLQNSGAWAIDVGCAASNPDAEAVTPRQEIERLQSVLPQLQQAGMRVSVDSYQSEVQLFALKQGVELLNDIQGFPDEALYPELARFNSQLIVMHSIQRQGQANRLKSDPTTIMSEIEEFFSERIDRLTQAGIQRDRLILDPGMGFFLGSNADSSVTVLRQIERIKSKFQLPVLISVSRKSFLGEITGQPIGERGAATLAAELFAVKNGADYIRTHDVAALNDGLKVQNSLEIE